MIRGGGVLIVDSEPAIADLLVDILTDAGYAALSASDGPSAFWLIGNYAPALLLLDMHLLDMTCFELIAQLRGSGVTAMPIVLMSTLTRDAERHVPGTRMCLMKPFDIDQMLACVAAYVQPTDIEAASAI